MSAKERAKRCPDDILVIAIHGSDQSSYGTPYFATKTKNSSKGWRMKWELVGALVTNRLMHFFTINNWATGPPRRSTLEAILSAAKARGISTHLSFSSPQPGRSKS